MSLMADWHFVDGLVIGLNVIVSSNLAEKPIVKARGRLIT